MNTPALPPILESKLAQFRKRVWIVKLAEGLLAAAFGLALSYAFVFVLDRFFETDAMVRGVILFAGAAVLGFGLPLKWHRWVWQQRKLEDAARLLRRKFPRLGDQLLGIVELSKHDAAETGRSDRLVQAAMAQAAEAVKDADFTHAVPQARHRQWGLAAGAVLAVVVTAFMLVSDAARNAASRWLMPWKNTERYTFARVDTLPRKLVVPYAEPFEMPVTLAQDSKWSPEQAKARIASQPAVNAKLNEGGYPLAFPPQKNDTAMNLKVGDVRKSVEIAPRTRPELTSLSAKLQLPAYLKYASEPTLEVRGGAISLLKGSKASFMATASRELAEAALDGKMQKVTGDKLITDYRDIASDSENHFTWKDRDGLTPREPLVLKVNAVEDEAPKIIARRETQEQVVLDSEVVAFDLSVQDDFGVQRVGLEWRSSAADGNIKTEDKGEKITSSGEPEKRGLDTRATFCAEREGVAPQTLEVRAWAEDYLPGRKRSYSAAYLLHVLNKTDHALWLTQQMGKWLQVARETYEREQQLHETNRELRALDVSELDRPENRRKVAQQASAENANAERLSALTSAGKNLVEQATKNPEFEAARLEAWAKMLKSLKDIAANRMPSVADLLKQAASAQSGKPSDGKPSDGKPSDGKPSDGKAADGKPSDGKPSDGKPSDGKPSDGKVADGKPSDGKPSDGKPSDGKPSDGKPSDSKPGDPSPSAPNITQGPQLPKADGPPPATDPNAPKPPPVPSIADNEGGFMKKPEAAPTDPNAPPAPPSAGKFGLPGTTLGAAPQKPDDSPPPPASPAQGGMQKALDEQRDLLAEFAKVSDKLAEILGSLESSTFVKRFKAASRYQMTIAGDTNKKTLSSFGIEDKSTKAGPPKDAALDASKREKDQSEIVRVIQGDLEAYFQRKPDQHFKNILEQMKKTEVVRALAKVGDYAVINYTGHTIHGAEFWADTLDRWAEEMVAAGKSSDSKPSSGSQDSLPPEIVLRVMQALRDEMKLRDETRELENAKAAIEQLAHKNKSQTLSRQQEKISMNIMTALDQILMIPQGSDKFGKELQLLGAVKQVMDEAGGILDKPDTGPEAIAAETEAIELLLQTRRQSPPKGGGGGGGNSPGGGGGAAFAQSAALSELGPGSDAATNVNSRPVGQSTGRAGKEFPAEFKAGLDSYFNTLENKGAGK